MMGPISRIDHAIGRCHARFTPIEKLPPALAALVFGILAALPFALHREAEFKSDDFLLIARGLENGLWDGFLRNLSRPFCDTWTIEFYRPLFTYSFCVQANLFGGRPEPYFWMNVLWQMGAVAAGHLVLRRLLEPRWASLATLLFIVNPWACNNVSWMVGSCSTVCNLLIFSGLLLYWRHQDRVDAGGARAGLRGLPWAAIVCAALADFWRETGLFLPVLACLADLLRRRRFARAFRDWCLLSAPFAVYLAAKYLVLGTLGGNYSRLAAMQGPRLATPDAHELMVRYGNAFLDLFAPGSGAVNVAFDSSPLRIAGLAAAGLVVLLGLWGQGLRRAVTWLFIVFVVGHGLPLIVVDSDIHGGTAQRWHLIMWAIAGLYAALARFSRLPNLAALAVIVLAGFEAQRLHENLGDYDRSAVYSKEARRVIQESGDDLVFVYNVLNYDGASAFYAVGMGQTTLPPFASGRKAVYPLMLDAKFGSDSYSQTPIAAYLRHRGEACSAIWLDSISRRAGRIPDAHVNAGWQRFESMPRLPVSLSQDDRPVDPEQRVFRDVQNLTVRVDQPGVVRIDVHVVCPLSELYFPRFSGLEYATARFEGGHYEEKLRDMLEATTLLDGPAKGRCWLWLVAYDRVFDAKALEPVAVSDFFELHVTIPQERPAIRR